MKNCITCFLLLLILLPLPIHSESHHPQQFLNAIKGTKQEGEKIYAHFCSNCHAQMPLIAVGAPRIGEERDWKSRLQQINLLFSHTVEGFNAMPPRGGCFECTDEQLVLSIITMVPKESKKGLLKALMDLKKYKE
jgi:cytochrome c5